MSLRSSYKLLAIGAVGVLLSVSHASAQTCSGTIVLASAESSTNPGSRCGDYTYTWYSDNYRETFTEALSGGVSRLTHQWYFYSVPAGSVSVIREGYRLASADGDNFKFQAAYDYNDGNGQHNIFGSFCTISSETEGTSKCSLGTTSDTATWTMTFVDTVTASGTALSTTAVDYLALCVE